MPQNLNILRLSNKIFLKLFHTFVCVCVCYILGKQQWPEQTGFWEWARYFYGAILIFQELRV